jgi:hypothetical protein
MSYEAEILYREINFLKQNKAEVWQLNDVFTKVISLSEKVTKLENEKSYLEERISKLEQIDFLQQ